MRTSTLEKIRRYPPGEQTDRPAEVINGVEFYDYDIGNGIHVWRTTDHRLEVGQVGGTYYGRVDFRILEQSFDTDHNAMRQCLLVKNMLADGEIAIQTFPPPPVPTLYG